MKKFDEFFEWLNVNQVRGVITVIAYAVLAGNILLFLVRWLGR